MGVPWGSREGPVGVLRGCGLCVTLWGSHGREVCGGPTGAVQALWFCAHPRGPVGLPEGLRVPRGVSRYPREVSRCPHGSLRVPTLRRRQWAAPALCVPPTSRGRWRSGSGADERAVQRGRKFRVTWQHPEAAAGGRP